MLQETISHPLDKLIYDEKLLLMEALIPFVQGPLKKILALYIKVTELISIANALDNPQLLNKSGFNLDINNQDQVFAVLSSLGYPNLKAEMENIKKVMAMSHMMENQNENESLNNIYNIFKDYDAESSDHES